MIVGRSATLKLALTILLIVGLAYLGSVIRDKNVSPAQKSSVHSEVSEGVVSEFLPGGGNVRDWLEGYSASSLDSREDLVVDGIAMAKARLEGLRALIRSDPEAALNEVLTLAEYADLPEELLPYFERPVSGYGDIDLLWATSIREDGSLQCSNQNRLHLNNESYDLYGPGRRVDQGPALNVPVFAYVLDDLALIPESPIFPVSGEERVAALSLFGGVEQGGLDPVTNQPIARDIAALIAGKVYQFSSSAVVEQITAELEELELATAESKQYSVDIPYTWLAGDTGGDTQGITQSSYFTDDDITVLFIRCDFSDISGSPVSQSDLQADLATISGHLNTMSYGAASITASVTTTLYRANGTGTFYAQSGDDDGLFDDIVARYDAAADYSASSVYDVVAIYFPDLGGVTNSRITYGGLASVGGSRHWINGLSSSFSRTEVITHEFGHNYGLYHANYWHPEMDLSSDPEDYNDPAGNSLEYGDIFDAMGDGSLPESHFSHYQKHRIDWIDDTKVQDVTVSGSYKIYRFDHMDADDNPLLALRIPMGGSVYYWVGFRQLYTSNTNAFNGAYVVAEGLYANRPNLIDMTPESAVSESSDRFDACLPVGSSFNDAAAGVTITVLSKGTDGFGDEWLNVQVDLETRVGLVSDVYEYDESAGVAYVELERLFSGAGVVSVDYATVDGSATAGLDYYASSGSVTWGDGDTAAKQVSVAVRPDVLVEGVENFTVQLSNPSAASLAVGQASETVSILDPGQRYSSFTPDFFNNTVRAIGFQSDGRAIIGGTISHTSGDFFGVGNIARIDSRGDVDGAFNSGGAGFNGSVEQIIVQPDDSIIARGSFTSYNGISVPGVALLAANGALDTSFNSNLGSAANAAIYTIALESNGQILVGGAFTEFNGTATEALVRLNANGSVDDSLNLPFVSSWASRVRGIYLEPDGKFVVVGGFYLGGGANGLRSGIARLHADGTRDASFDPDAGLHGSESTNNLRTGYSITKLPDGDYIVGGFFSRYDQNPVDNFVRINHDGSFDRAYGTAFDEDPEVVLVEPFGALLVGGSFNSPVTDFIRIQPDWTEDTGFQSSGGPDLPDAPGRTVYALAHAPDGSLWLGGNLFSYNGSSSRPVVRLASGISPYDFWAQDNFTLAEIASGDAGPDQDPDGDGIENLGEMALSTDPTVADASSVFGSGNLSGLSLADVSGSQYLQFSLDKSALPGGVWYSVQLSSDLTSWSPDPAVPGDDTHFTILEDSGERLIIRDKTPISVGTPRFARIVLSKPE